MRAGSGGGSAAPAQNPSVWAFDSPRALLMGFIFVAQMQIFRSCTNPLPSSPESWNNFIKIHQLHQRRRGFSWYDGQCQHQQYSNIKKKHRLRRTGRVSPNTSCAAQRKVSSKREETRRGRIRGPCKTLGEWEGASLILSF